MSDGAEIPAEIVAACGNLGAAAESLVKACLEAGESAERARVAAILNSPAAEGQPTLAIKLVLSDLTSPAAIAALQVAKLATAHPPEDGGARLPH